MVCGDNEIIIDDEGRLKDEIVDDEIIIDEEGRLKDEIVDEAERLKDDQNHDGDQKERDDKYILLSSNICTLFNHCIDALLLN